MKKIVKFALVSLFVMMAVACSDKEYGGNGYLEVTPNNISGAWSMESYDNGVPLADGSYYYIVFDRAERRFESFDNLGSMEMYKRSGRYDINTNGAAIIRGIYDFGQGDWEHQYYVRDLTKERMVWVAVDDESVVKVYVRAELPEWIPAEE